MLKRLLSFGGGVQTTALAILAAKGEVPKPDAIVFADTGDESPETYAHIEEFARWLKDRKLPFVTVRRPGPDIIESYTAHNAIPFRRSRSCTENFKVKPIRQFIRDHGHAATTYRSPEKPLVDLGISWDEMDRMYDSDVKWIVNDYPLINQRIDRTACKKVIAETGFDAVAKSGCMGCPFQSERSLALAARRHPDRIERIAKMEDNAREKRGRRMVLVGQKWTVRQIIDADQRTLELFPVEDLPMPCNKAGYCRV